MANPIQVTGEQVKKVLETVEINLATVTKSGEPAPELSDHLDWLRKGFHGNLNLKGLSLTDRISPLPTKSPQSEIKPPSPETKGGVKPSKEAPAIPSIPADDPYFKNAWNASDSDRE